MAKTHLIVPGFPGGGGVRPSGFVGATGQFIVDTANHVIRDPNGNVFQIRGSMVWQNDLRHASTGALGLADTDGALLPDANRTR